MGQWWRTKGDALIELLVAMGIAALVMPAVVTAFFAARGGTGQEQLRIQATARVREAREALYIVREGGWSNLATNGTYYPSIVGNNWTLVPSATGETLGLFKRKIEIGDAYRNGSGQLATSGTVDPSVKHVTITVSWGSIAVDQVTADFYLMRFDNLAWIQTLGKQTPPADFDLGIQRSTQVTKLLDGEVQLGTGSSGIGDWCKPSLVLQALDLDGQGVTTALSAVPGHGYASTGNNSSGHPLYAVSITNPVPPTQPTATQTGFFDPTPQRKAYSLYATDSRVYVSTSKYTVDIVNSGTLTEAGYFDTGKGQGDTVYVSGNVGYTTVGTTLYAFNLAGGINPAPQLATTTIAGIGKKLIAVGNYLYVATESTTAQLQIFDVTNVLGGTIAPVASFNAGNNQPGVDVWVSPLGNYAYLVTKYANPNFFIIDLTNKAAPIVAQNGSQRGTYITAASMQPSGLAVIAQDQRAIIVGSGGTTPDYYQVLNITLPYAPTRCDPGLNFAASGFTSITGINAISAVTETDGDAYAYVMTNDSSREFVMIQGGPGGGAGGSAKTGVYESAYFDAGSAAVWNRFTATTQIGMGQAVQYQIAIANPVNGSCANANYTFVGPNKIADPSDEFTGPAPIPLGTSGGYTNPGQCIKYRAYLSTGNVSSSPILDDVTFNYSP